MKTHLRFCEKVSLGVVGVLVFQMWYPNHVLTHIHDIFIPLAFACYCVDNHNGRSTFKHTWHNIMFNIFPLVHFIEFMCNCMLRARRIVLLYYVDFPLFSSIFIPIFFLFKFLDPILAMGQNITNFKAHQ